jgi:hypothetical protein
LSDILTTTTTDANGAFAFRNVALPEPYLDEVPRGAPCPWDVVVIAKDHGLGWERLTSLTGRQTLELALPAAAKISGRVVDPEGKPVAKAGIRVIRIQALDQRPQANPTTADNLNLESSRLPLAASSDADGRFTLAGLPANVRIAMSVTGDRFLGQTAYAATTDKPQPDLVVGRSLNAQGAVASQEQPVHTDSFTITLKPSHRLLVRVVHGDNKPVPGARVAQAPPPMTFPESGATDAEGKVSFTPVAPGRYTLKVMPPDKTDLLGIFLAATIPADKNEVEMTANLPSGVPVTGQVVELETGKPIPEALVAYQAQAGGAPREVRTLAPTSRTGPDGQFRLVVPPGKGRLHAGEVPGYVRLAPATSEPKEAEGRSIYPVEVVAGKPLSGIKLTLTRGIVAHLHVTDPEGKPVAGARSLGFASDKEGRLTLSGLDLQKNRELFVTHDDHQLAARIALPAPKDKEPIRLEVKLQPMGSISGRIVGDDRKPVTKATVQLLKEISRPDGKKGYDLAPVAPLTTDRDGRYTIEDLLPGTPYAVAVAARGYVTAFSAVFEARSGQARSIRDVVLPQANQTVAGIVVDAAGKPLAGIQVNAMPAPRGAGIEHTLQVSEGQTATDKDGRFRFSRFPKGPVRLFAYRLPSRGGLDPSGRAQASAQAEAGQEDIRIVLVSQAKEEGDMVAGKPAPEFPVRHWLHRPGNAAENSFKRADFQNQLVLLAFLDDAKPSERLLPRLNQLQEKLAKNGVIIIRVYEVENPREELTKLSSTPAALVAPGQVSGGYSEAFQKYGAKATPAIFLIDRQGVLRYADVEPDALETRLQELLKP